MARKQQTKGRCNFCQTEMTKGGLSRHLATCKARPAGTGQVQSLYHLKIEDTLGGDFWLYVEMKGSATLKDLDYYLRKIWLECCGHMSQFSFGGWRGEEIGMSRKIKDVFTVGGGALTHIYDFGTESQTLIKATLAHEGKPLSKHPLFLMARNNPPEVTCMECDKPAQWLCIDCMWSDNKTGLLCDEHSETHDYEDYDGPLAFVNSPRTGLCGYDGPAEPPY